MRLQEIVSQLNEAYDGNPWFGNSISTYLQEITGEMLNNRLENGHSIGQIIDHMITWRKYTIDKLKNEPTAITVGSPEDWNGKRYVPEDLTALYSQFRNTQKELNRLLAERDDAFLMEKVPGEEILFQKLLWGIIAHDIYHLGQIYLLKSVR